MFCSKCGKPVDEDDRFCWNCGREVKKVTLSPEREEDPAPSFFSSSAEKEVPAHAETASNSDRAVTEDGVTPTPSDSEPQDSAPRRISTDEFVWNIHEFQRPAKKPDKIYVDWKSGKVIEVDEFGNGPDATEGQEESVETQSKNPNAVRKHTSQDEHLTPKAENHTDKRQHTSVEVPSAGTVRKEAQDEDIPVSIEDITKDIEESNADLKRATARIDKFYTFNQKNEEFQKLLDKEYERVHGSVPPDTAQIFLEFERLTNPDFQEPETIAEKQTNKDFAPADTERMTATAASNAGTDIHKMQETDSVVQAEKAKAFDPVQHLKESTAARQAELAKSGIFDNDTIIKKFDTLQLEKDVQNETGDAADGTLAKEKGTRTAMLDELFGEIKQPQDNSAENPAVALESEESSEANAGAAAAGIYNVDSDLSVSPVHRQEDLDASLGFIVETPAKESALELKPQDKAVTDTQAELDEQLGLAADTSKENEEGDAESIEAISVGTEEGIGNEQAKTEIATNAAKEDTQAKVDDFFASIQPEEEKGGAGKIIGRTLLVIVVILILAGLTAIGIRHFAPESNASRFIDRTFSAVSDTFTGLTAKMGLDEDESQPDGARVEDEALPKMMDMPEIISSQIGNNTNIENISYNPNIGYDKNIDYGKTDLNTSVSLAEKYPSAEDYNKNASDIVGMLISFDSRWIDYVNTKDRAVFELLKESSNAYRNCNAYKKAGLVKKYFKDLNIGEIRVGENGYYIWANEKIVTVENGKSAEENFSWIYYFESDGANLRLVDYIRDKK